MDPNQTKLLRRCIEWCELCETRKQAHQPVPGIGNLGLAKICFIGRNPGRQEDQEIEPFVGRAGHKLTEGMMVAGILRNSVYITNVVKCMTIANTVPSRVAIAACDVWLQKELAALERLKLIVTLGNEALRVFEPLGSVGELHGTSWPYVRGCGCNDQTDLEIFCSYHPSAALRSTEYNERFMADMKKLKGLVNTVCKQ